MTFVALAACLSLLVALGWWYGRRRKPRGPSRPPIIVDGSNVMHWGDGVPKANTLRAVVAALSDHGYAPLIYFDANVGYKLANRHMPAAELAGQLGVPVSQIYIVPSGKPADPLLIERAINLKARVVSNDRFMDWRADYSQIRGKGFLVKGDVRGRSVQLQL